MKRKTNRRFVASGQKTNSARRIRRRPRQTREPASGARDVIDHSSYSLMDEEDIVEMSMLAQEIKSYFCQRHWDQCRHCLPDQTVDGWLLVVDTLEPDGEAETQEFTGNVSSHCIGTDADTEEFLRKLNEPMAVRSNTSLVDNLRSE
ncbi:hypothetical protein KIN20_032412 [Parelaphostrongylus tenuis]|uniref:Uncharacterized protein n=1 Tax=Parelaphostrongylus tenuis TaxID=148309 RepID=A0AAD5WHH6_PARTN|nr:hypothetical protein KIN20_032412 [Parelaphostrongylus tenuis]